LERGCIPIVTVEPSGGWPSGSIPTGSGITTYANGFVTIAQDAQAAYPDVPMLFEIINEPWNLTVPATAAQYAAVVIATLDACQTAGISLETIWAWLLQNEFPFVSVVEALLVSFDVEFPVGVEVA
jgi:hypothetical protein